MKKFLLSFIAFFLVSSIGFIYGQVKLEIPIQGTGDSVSVVVYLNEEETDSTTVVVYLSSDDAEQEQDAMDALFDDDLDAGWDGEETELLELHMGLRFRDITIPPGATINSASIVLHSHEAKNAEDVCNVTIVGEATDNAETFTLDALITARPQTTATARWEVAEAWELWEPYSTPDLSSIIQEIVDRDGWVSGNALAFIFLGEDDQGATLVENAREFESFENIADPTDEGPNGFGDGANHPERVPKLLIDYTPPPGYLEVPIRGTGDSVSVVVYLNEEETDSTTVVVYLSSDDAEQEQDAMDALFDDDLDAGWDGEETELLELHMGLRFTDITIPKGATIDNASIILHSHEAKNAEDVCNVTIVGEATDNAETFTLDALITARPQTTATARWEVAEAWELWEPYSTPDLSSIIQEIVDRDGWVSGNALAFIFLGEDDQGATLVENAREFESFENIADPTDEGPNGFGDGANHPERVPKLVINYSTGTSVDEIKDQLQFVNVFPNPSTGILHVSFQSPGTSQIEIFNVTGQLVRSAEITSKTATLNVSDLQSGVYILKVVQNNKAFTQKVILE